MILRAAAAGSLTGATRTRSGIKLTRVHSHASGRMRCRLGSSLPVCNADLEQRGFNRHDHEAGLFPSTAGGALGGNTIYRGCMGRLLLIVLAGIAAFMLLGIVVSALHFIFWIAVVALIVVVGMRLTGSARRRARR